MRRVVSLCVWIVTAVLCVGSNAARAEDSTEAVETMQPEADVEADLSPIADAHAQLAAVVPPAGLSDNTRRFGELLAYAGIDGWRNGGSAYVGAEWSPTPQSAFVLRLFAADGLDDFKTATTTYRSETTRASLLPGVHLQSGKLDIKLFAGADFMMRTPLRPALEGPLLVFGARATVDVWLEPAENWMLSGSASATTIENGISGRIASGWRLPFAWVGPEVLAIHDVYNTQYRAGAHLTGLKLGITEWSLAGGYVRDDFGRSGPYGRIGLTLRP